MKNEDKKYMTTGKEVKIREKRNYILVEGMNENKDMVKAVEKRDYAKYRELVLSDNPAEAKKLEKTISTDNCIPADDCLKNVKYVPSTYSNFDTVLVKNKTGEESAYTFICVDDNTVCFRNINGNEYMYNAKTYELLTNEKVAWEKDNWEKIKTLFATVAGMSTIPGKEFKKVREGEVVDEEKSVRWNREEVERLRKKYHDEVKRLRRERNNIFHEAIERAIRLLSKELDIPYKKASVLWRHIYDKHHSSINDLFANLEDYIDLMHDMLK